MSFMLVSASSNLKTNVDLLRYCLHVICIALHMINLYILFTVPVRPLPNMAFGSQCPLFWRHMYVRLVDHGSVSCLSEH